MLPGKDCDLLDGKKAIASREVQVGNVMNGSKFKGVYLALMNHLFSLFLFPTIIPESRPRWKSTSQFSEIIIYLFFRSIFVIEE